MVQTKTSWNRRVLCSEVRGGTLDVPLATVPLGPGVMGREEDLAGCLLF